MKPLTLITPACQCCPQPQTLLPRDDLGAGLAVCEHSGQLYRPAGAGYVPGQLPELNRPQATAPQAIDLSQVGYA